MGKQADVTADANRARLLEQESFPDSGGFVEVRADNRHPFLANTDPRLVKRPGDVPRCIRGRSFVDERDGLIAGKPRAIAKGGVHAVIASDERRRDGPRRPVSPVQRELIIPSLEGESVDVRIALHKSKLEIEPTGLGTRRS